MLPPRESNHAARNALPSLAIVADSCSDANALATVSAPTVASAATWIAWTCVSLDTHDAITPSLVATSAGGFGSRQHAMSGATAKPPASSGAPVVDTRAASSVPTALARSAQPTQNSPPENATPGAPR